VWCPLPISPKQRLVAKLIEEETVARAKRHGMTRAQFLRTAAATGDPAGSLLWNVLAKGLGIPEADALPGIAMPIGGRLTQEDVDTVRLWIAAGAPHDAIVPGTEAFLVPCPDAPPR
jgi:hypothetical protein